MSSMNEAYAVATILLQITTVALILLWFLRRAPGMERVVLFVRERGVMIGFLIALGGTLASLHYAYGIGYAACDLCWFQRVFLYPQAIILGMALWTRDARATLYSIIFSILGAAVALYQHVLQMMPSGTLPCPAGDGPSCAARVIFEFGYITMPLMSFTLFAFLIALMLFVRQLDCRQDMV